MSHVFISYSKKNRAYARRLADHLEAQGFDYWIDDRIDFGDQWWRVIDGAIRECSAFVVIMTPESDESDWVYREMMLAINQDKPMFPLRLDGECWGLFVGEQYADVRNGSLPPDGFCDRLAEHAPRRKAQTGANVTEAPLPDMRPTAIIEPERPTADVESAIAKFYRARDEGRWTDALACLRHIRESGDVPDWFGLAERQHEIQSEIAREEEEAAAERERREWEAARDREYAIICLMAKHEDPTRVWAALRVFWETYKGYDPEGLTALCAEAERQRLEIAERARKAREITPTPRTFQRLEEESAAAPEPTPTPPVVQVAEAASSPKRRLPAWALVGGALVGGAVIVGALALAGVFGGGAAPEEEYEAPMEEPAAEETTAEPTEEPEPTETSIPLGFEPVTHNDDWEPIIQDFDGAQMALVPAGCFMMGSSEDEIDYTLELCETYYGNCDRAWFEDEAPQHEVCFEEPFWIDVYEVTNVQYGSSGHWSGSDLPRETVDWFDAADHCESRGTRLPTEAEWEYAARGPDGLVFPWGNEFDGAQLNYCDSNCEYEWADADIDDGHANTAPVGSYPGGVSWVGVYDLSGNVWEWVNSLYEPYPYDATDGREVGGSNNSSDTRVLRGGSWSGNATALRAAYRDRLNPDLTANNDGFRCALSQ